MDEWELTFFTRASFNFIGARFDDGAGGDNEVQRTMLELINQLDGFDPRGNIKVLMATNRYGHNKLINTFRISIKSWKVFRILSVPGRI